MVGVEGRKWHQLKRWALFLYPAEPYCDVRSKPIPVELLTLRGGIRHRRLVDASKQVNRGQLTSKYVDSDLRILQSCDLKCPK